MASVLFVCLGNICRSPTAHGVFERLVEQAGLVGQVRVDSAGTAATHAGELPDSRSRAVAKARGLDLTHRARQIVREDFQRFDLLVAMDGRNHGHLVAMAPDAAARNKVKLLRDYEPGGGPAQDVPDPYYGGDDGFARVLDLCEAACAGLLTVVRREHGL